MDRELIYEIEKAPSSTYKKIIIGLLVVIQTLAVFLCNSAYNRLTTLEKMDDNLSSEIEGLNVDLAVMRNRLDNLQEQSDAIESIIIGSQNFRGAIRMRDKNANNS